MSLKTLLRRKQDDELEEDVAAQFDEADDVEEVDETLPPVATATEQVSTNWTARLIAAGLFVCIGLGVLGFGAGVLTLLQSTGQAQTAPSVVADHSDEQAAAGEYAQRVVHTWLTSTRDNGDALLEMVSDAQLATLNEEPFRVDDSTVSGITSADGVWSVTVAATVTDALDNTARRYYQVSVVVSDSGVSALTLPTPVQAPAATKGTTSEYRASLDTTSPLGDTVAQFLAAYAAGSGDVARYLTPGVDLPAIDPAPYAEVSLTDLRALDSDTEPTAPTEDGQQLRVLAIASGVVTDTQSSTVAYALTLTGRAGRWEITEIDPAPATDAEELPTNSGDDPSSAAGNSPDPSAPTGTTPTTP